MKIRVFEAFSGIGAQAMSLKRLQAEHPDMLDFEFIGTSEIEPSAIKAYKAVHGDTRCYGDITRIDWNEVPDFDLFTMSSPCFVAGTLIHTERGYIPIEQVTTADNVLTHTNKYQRVLAVGHNDNSPIIKVRGMCFKDILCTPNHPFLVRKRYRIWNNDKRKYDRKFDDAKWISAECLTKDHFVGYAINQKSELPVWNGITATRWKRRENQLLPLLDKPDFWYLMGRYVGDGWKRESWTGSAVIVCCSDRNRESLYNAIDSLGLHRYSIQERTVEKVFITMNELYAFVERYGYYAHGKKIDEETINLPVPLLQSFVQGYIDSDGCYTENEYKVTSVSEELMYGIQHCIVKAYRCPVRMYWCKRNPTAIIEGGVVNQRDSYSLAWHIGKRKQDKAFYEDGYVWFPIKEVINLNERATVYNMEVENDNSYTANGAIVHNCQDFSVAGRQAGAEEGSGTRSSLLWECRKAIVAKRPKYILFENVSAVASKKFIRGFNKWQAELESYGYTNFSAILDSSKYGVPQHRERLFMVSILNCDKSYHFPKPFKLEKRIKDILEPYGTVDEGFYFSPEQLHRTIAHCDKKIEEGCGFKNKFVEDDDVAGCVTSRYGQRETDTYLKEGISIHPLSRKMEFKGYKSGKQGAPVLWQRLEPAILTPQRTEEAKELRRKGIEVFKHRELVPREDGASNTITTVQKDSMVAEPYGVTVHPLSRKLEFKGVGDKKDIAPCLRATDYKGPHVLWEKCGIDFEGLPDKTVLVDEDGKGYLWQDGSLWRVRKLVPIEVGRLMDCSDEDVRKMIDAGISKTALYGLFGNSIVVNVLYHIFRKLWVDTEDDSLHKSLFDC